MKVKVKVRGGAERTRKERGPFGAGAKGAWLGTLEKGPTHTATQQIDAKRVEKSLIPCQTHAND